MSFCAPNIDIKEHYTCFSEEELFKIANAFNSYHQKKVCKGEKCIIKNPIDISKKTKKQLWYSIYKRLKPLCKYEYCWIELEFFKKFDQKLLDKIMYYTFKPKMTPKYNSWLSTVDINAILGQYEKLFTNFKFLGAQPSDFYKIKKVERIKKNGNIYHHSLVLISSKKDDNINSILLRDYL